MNVIMGQTLQCCQTACQSRAISFPSLSRLQHTPFLRVSVQRHSIRSNRCRVPTNFRVQANQLTYGADTETPKESYLVLGVAHCFEKNEDGKLIDRFVIEPVSANSLECMCVGAKTCFKIVTSLTLGEALQKDKSILPQEFQDSTVFCEDWEFRCGASARTWSRPHAQDNLMDIVPFGKSKSNFNFNLDDKRILNFENVVNDDDNIKQDISIDVYGRKEKEEAAQAEEQQQETQPQEEEEDALDSLLSV